MIPVKVGQLLHCINVHGNLIPATIVRLTPCYAFTNRPGRLDRASLDKWGRWNQRVPDLMWYTDEAIEQQAAEHRELVKPDATGVTW